VTPQERTAIAWQAYRLAVQAARAESTPASWERLLRAAHYLREALGQAATERGRANGRW